MDARRLDPVLAVLIGLLAGCTCNGVASPVNGVIGPDGNPIVVPDMRPIPKSPDPWDQLEPKPHPRQASNLPSLPLLQF